MGLKLWNEGDDPYNHEQLADNFAKIGSHTHASGKGVQIPTGGIESGAITLPLLSSSLFPLEKTLPGAPENKQVIYFEASGANGIIWGLRFRESINTYKWEYIGGPFLSSGYEGAYTQESATEHAFSTGPTLTVPLTGEYEIELGVSIHAEKVAGKTQTNEIILGKNAATTNVVYIPFELGENTELGTRVRGTRIAVLTTGDTLTMFLKTSFSNKVKLENGRIGIRPVRV